MNPYYQDDSVTLYHGDCRDILPSLVFDSLVTDAPYGVSLDYDEYDDSLAGLDALVAFLTPTLLDGRTHAVFSGVGNLHRWPQPTWTLCWYEPAGTHTGKWGFSTWQPVLAYGKDPRLNGRGRLPDSLRTTATSGRNLRSAEGTGVHPCPKPLRVVSWLIERATSAAATLVDPFAGAGTVLVAAKASGRGAIGVELSERYCEIAATRLAQGALDFGTLL